MRLDKKELLSYLVVPVIPDNSIYAHALALRLYLRYGVRATLCGSRRNVFDIFNPLCEFLKVSEGKGDLFIRSLKDFSEEMSGYITILIPADEADRLFIENRKAELESFYILAGSYEEFENLPPIKFA